MRVNEAHCVKLMTCKQIHRPIQPDEDERIAGLSAYHGFQFQFVADA